LSLACSTSIRPRTELSKMNTWAVRVATTLPRTAEERSMKIVCALLPRTPPLIFVFEAWK
jgi:hypothetical protein